MRLACRFSALLLSILALGFVPTGFATDIGISPPRVALTGRPGETLTATVDVVAGAGKAQQIEVRASDWTLDSDGNVTVLPAGAGPASATAWVTPETDAFELESDSTRPFRISVTIPDDPTLAGTYASLVFFRVVPDVPAASGVAVVTTTQIGFTLYVTVAGTETTGSALTDLYLAQGRAVHLAVRNDGNTLMRLNGRVELRDEAGEVMDTLPVDDVPVLRESEREISLALPDDVSPGTYVALALVEDSRGGLLSGQALIDVP